MTCTSRLQDFIRAAEEMNREVSRDNKFEENVIHDLISCIEPSAAVDRAHACAHTAAELLDYLYRRNPSSEHFEIKVNRLWKKVLEYDWHTWAINTNPNDETVHATLLYKVRVHSASMCIPSLHHCHSHGVALSCQLLYAHPDGPIVSRDT